MAFTVLVITLLLLLLLLSGSTRMSLGVGAAALGMLASWPELAPALDLMMGGFGAAHLVAMGFGAVGLSMVSSSWTQTNGRPVATLAIPTAAFIVFLGVVGFWSWQRDLTIETGHLGYELVVVVFKVLCILAALRVTFIASRTMKLVRAVREKFLLAFTRASGSVVILGCMTSLIVQFADIAPDSDSLRTLRAAANAAAFSGGIGIACRLLYATVESLMAKVARKRKIKTLMPALEQVWEKALATNPDLIHPLAGTTVEARAHRMTIEIHDATTHAHGLLEALDEEDYVILETMEEHLSA